MPSPAEPSLVHHQGLKTDARKCLSLLSLLDFPVVLSLPHPIPVFSGKPTEKTFAKGFGASWEHKQENTTLQDRSARFLQTPEARNDWVWGNSRRRREEEKEEEKGMS